MKKLLTLLLIIASFYGFSQQYSTPLRVKDSTTAFVSIVPISTIVQDTTTGNLWQLRAKGLVGHSLANTAKQLIADPLIKSNVKNLIHDSIVGKQDLIASPTTNHIVTTNSLGQTQDGGKLFNDAGTTTNDIFTASKILSIKSGLQSYTDSSSLWQTQMGIGYTPLYGRLYNWYAVNTGKLCPTGWHVPSVDEWTTLSTTLGGDAISGGKLKETGTTHWITPNTGATNASGFTALPGGSRYGSGSFYDVGNDGYWWSSAETNASYAFYSYLYFLGSYRGYDYSGGKVKGYSVRCLRNDNPNTSIVSDADNNIYDVIAIGSQYWLKQNLATTKYNDGTAIPNVTDGATWTGLTTGAYCNYNNSMDSVLRTIPFISSEIIPKANKKINVNIIDGLNGSISTLMTDSLKNYVSKHDLDSVTTKITTRSTVIWIDGNRTDPYTENGSIQFPYKTFASALATTPTTAVEIHLAPGTYVETTDITLPNVPLTIYGNGATISASGHTITFTNPNSTRYDLFTTANVVYSNFATGARNKVFGGSITGNVTCNAYCEFIQCQLNGGTVTVSTTGQLFVQTCTPTSKFVQTGGFLGFQNVNLNTAYAGGYLVTSTGGQLSINSSFITNTSTATGSGGISCNNGATTVPNSIANTVITTAGSGYGVNAGTSVTIYSKNYINASNTISGSALAPVNTDMIGAGTVMALGSDATGDMYYRNATGFLTRLGVGASGQVLNGGTVPSWGPIPAGANQYLNLSTSGSSLMIAGQDLNSSQKTGFFCGNHLLNAPNSDAGYWYIENQAHDGMYMTETATAYGVEGSAVPGTTFRRTNVYGTWFPWYQVYDARTANNAATSWTSNVLKVYPTGGGNSYNQGIRIHPSTSDDKSSLVLGAVTGDDNTGVGQWAINRMPSANNYQLNYNYNGTDVANLTKEGNFTANYIYGYKAIGTLSCDSVTTGITIPSSTNWMKVTSFNTNELQQGVTVSVPFSNITVQRAGKYQVNYYFSSNSNINASLNTCVFVNGVKSKLRTIRYLSANVYVEASAMDVLTLSANDVIDVRVYQNSGSSITVIPQYGKLSVTYLSE